jgi:hypothetical protein
MIPGGFLPLDSGFDFQAGPFQDYAYPALYRKQFIYFILG